MASNFLSIFKLAVNSFRSIWKDWRLFCMDQNDFRVLSKSIKTSLIRKSFWCVPKRSRSFSNGSNWIYDYFENESKILYPSIDKSREITFSVIGKFGTSEIEGIDEEKRKSTSGTSGENVWSKFLPLWSRFWGGENGLDFILEGKVQSLCWEISDAVSKIS